MHTEAAHIASSYTNASAVSDPMAAFCSNIRKRALGNQAAHEYVTPPSTHGSAAQFSSPLPAVSDPIAAFSSNKRNMALRNQAAHEYIMPPSTHDSSAAQFSSLPPAVSGFLANPLIASPSDVASQSSAFCSNKRKRGSGNQVAHPSTHGSSAAQFSSRPPAVSDPNAAYCSNKRKRGPGNQAAHEYIMPSSTHGSSAAQFSSPPTGFSSCYVFKSRLQEYAQKKGLATPVYETIKEGPSHEPTFRSTVIVKDVRYDSLTGFSNRKAAEQSAAEVALAELAKLDEVECIAQPVHETGLCKNLLQEYAQKMNYAIPLYQCQKDEKRGRATNFKCMVEIGGIQYIGASATTKKEAELKAARTALLAIQSSGSESHISLGNSQLTVIPFRKRGTESPTASVEGVNVTIAKKKGLSAHRKMRKNLSKMKKRNRKAGKLDVIVDGISRPEPDQTCASSVVQAMGGNGLLPVSAGVVSELHSSKETTNDVLSSENQNVLSNGDATKVSRVAPSQVEVGSSTVTAGLNPLAESMEG